MKINDLRKMSDKELLEQRDEMQKLLMSSYAKIKPKIKATNRGNVRITLARIDTILGERGRRGFTKNKIEVMS